MSQLLGLKLININRTPGPRVDRDFESSNEPDAYQPFSRRVLNLVQNITHVCFVALYHLIFVIDTIDLLGIASLYAFLYGFRNKYEVMKLPF